MLIAALRLPSDAVALAEALDDVPDMRVEAEQIAAHSTTWTMPGLWVTAPDFGAVDDAFANDPTVDTVVEAAEFGDEKFYQVDWSDAVDDRIDDFLDRKASVLSAEATTGGWRLRIRFVARDQFDAFRSVLHDRGHSFELLSLVQRGESRHEAGELTSPQREALRVAKERGYFEIPREVSARDLAADLDMSHQNLSELLRRATGQLIENILDVPSADDEQ